MKTTRINLFLVLIVLLSSGTAVLGQTKDHGKAGDKIQAPEPVLTAFHKAYPKAAILDVSKETKDGKTYYEIESIDGNQRRDLLYIADGNVFEIEESWDIDKLPHDIVASLKSEYPGGKLQKAERITQGSTIQYEVLLENREDNLEILIDSKGTIISRATADDNDEEADTGENDEADED